MKKTKWERISLTVTLNCSLNCELCCAFVPYKNPKPHWTLETLSKNVDRFFEIAESVDIFVICGGEPLVHKDLPEIIEHIGKYRSRIYKRLEVITNGTIMPSERLIDSMVKNSVNVLIDDYGKYSPKAENVYELLIDRNVPTILRANNKEKSHFDGWLNYDFDPSSRDINAHNFNPKAVFKNCLSANELRCYPIMNNRIYLCTPQEHLEALGIVELEDKYSIDLTKDITEQQINDFHNLDCLSGCQYCYGWRKDEKRYAPAEQLGCKEE